MSEYERMEEFKIMKYLYRKESYLKAGYEEKTKDEIGDIYNNIIINKLENRLQQINIERLSVETELEYRRNKIN
jgi:hypothetical protein